MLIHSIWLEERPPSDGLLIKSEFKSIHYKTNAA